MKTHAWLAELHRQWMKSRGRRVDAGVRAFARKWDDLLDDANLSSAEDRQAAQREAEALEQQGRLKLHRLRGRSYILQKIELPLDQEAWLHESFGTQAGADVQQRSLQLINEWSAKDHPLLPEQWQTLCTTITEAITASCVAGPFNWREPERMGALLSLLFAITAREWLPGTLIRDASVTLGYDSKHLESQQAALTRALDMHFTRETPLEALGIQSANSILHFSGPLTLHFEDGTRHETDALRTESTLTIAELERSVRITTTAERILSIENRKTTFLQFARADTARSTLIIATSFPTLAVRRLLEKLPLELPHHHFGDTDVAGFHILQKLRQLSERQVSAFHMRYRIKEASRSLTQTERNRLQQLFADPLMADCHPALQAMRDAECVGDFEQEALGPPTLQHWPFYADMP